ncbi:probable gamma-secretase subunit PEN-2 [Primulina eburnea]|uniref:probable gamma-secretase subunit PEN-2 n=1 Tax=Primulina eburnea TaxID=1245227 RepID=UPI003C6C5932
MENESSHPLPVRQPSPAAAPVAADVGNSSPSSSRRYVRSEWPTIDGPLGLSHDESLTYARRFFKWGFFCLPFLWAVNCFYFWPLLRRPHSRHSDPLLRRYLVGSAIGFLVFTAILTSWALTFAIGGEHLFGNVWDTLVMYNVADRYGLTGWI